MISRFRCSYSLTILRRSRTASADRPLGSQRTSDHSRMLMNAERRKDLGFRCAAPYFRDPEIGPHPTATPVSNNSLRKTGIFAEWAGDFLRFSPRLWSTRRRETRACARKAGISRPFRRVSGRRPDLRNGWLGREGSNLRMAESKSAALPLGYAPTGPLKPRDGRPRGFPPAPPVYRGSPTISTGCKPDFRQTGGPSFCHA
jgi:hypothetical protein